MSETLAEIQDWYWQQRQEHAQWEFERGGSILNLMLADFRCHTVEELAASVTASYRKPAKIKDPFDLVAAYGRAGWDRAMAAAEPVVVSWARRKLESNPQPDAVTVRGWLTSELAPTWRGIPDELLRREVAEQVADVFGISATEAIAVMQASRAPTRQSSTPPTTSFRSVVLDMLEDAG